jgi:hypothetical protein
LNVSITTEELSKVFSKYTNKAATNAIGKRRLRRILISRGSYEHLRRIRPDRSEDMEIEWKSRK